MLNNRKIKMSVLTIAATDSAGMAGINMDIKTQAAFNVHTLSVITANTAQNNQQVFSINPVNEQVLREQLNAISSADFSVIKTGLIDNQRQINILTEFLNGRTYQLVIDPVFTATSGGTLTQQNTIEALKALLLSKTTLITPNIDEARIISGLTIETVEDMQQAAKKIQAMGANAVLIKGGHLNNNSLDNHLICQDYFFSSQQCFWLTSPRIETKNTRGTGCALASSIASALSLGYSLENAVVIGKMAINQGLRNSYSVKKQKGPLSIIRFPNEQTDLPILSETAQVNIDPLVFPECNQTPLGLYPVVDSAKWLERILSQGITTAQLRIKELLGEALEGEVIKSILIARKYNCRLFINDYWQLAIKHNAYGVHLGQEDLDDADIKVIHKAGLRLGISTHCHYEVARAHRYRPSYIACGPVYHTNSKDMPWIPHDLKGLSYWRDVLDYPLVAIGGICANRIKPVATTGVDGVAMITAITLADDPEKAIKEFMMLVQQQKI